MASANECLDLFSTQPDLLSVVSSRYEVFRTNSNLTANPERLSFLINADLLSYTDLYNSFLVWEGRLGTHTPGVQVAQDEEIPPVGVCDYIFSSIFGYSEIYINDVKIGSSTGEKNHHLINYIYAISSLEGTQK